MKKILFPTDFSEAANNAFVHALEFAKTVNGELILLHTFELPVYDSQFFSENYNVIFDTLQLTQFDLFKDQVPSLHAIAEERNRTQIKMSHRLMDGDLLFNINRAIKEENIDYIVMGTNGVNGWEAFFLGSNTGNVLAAVPIPVLSVPLESKFKKIETIGFTTRFRDKDKKALKEVLKFANRINAKVKCLYVKKDNSDVSSATIQEWEQDFLGEPIQFYIIPSEEVQATILDFILFKGIDVLAMLTYKRNFFVELFHPSLTQKFSNSLAIPVLAFHE
ncbi:MAG: universal stress protein [Flavobacterium sp.]|nr:universal stress protein [Flavobacterium sp.]